MFKIIRIDVLDIITHGFSKEAGLLSVLFSIGFEPIIEFASFNF